MHASKQLSKEWWVGEAAWALRKYCESNGYLFAEPNSRLSTVEGDRIMLRNVNGLLAKFKIMPSGKIRRLSPGGSAR